MATGASDHLKTCSRKSWPVFVEYASKTSVHGVRYVGEPSRLWFERLFWIFIIVVSGYLCTVVILDSWTHWNDNPVIVSFENKYLSVDAIPFPAVTICSEIKFNASVHDFATLYGQLQKQGTAHGFNQTTMDIMDTLLKVCDIGEVVPLKMNGKYVLGEHNIRLLKHLALNFEDTFVACGFEGSEVTFENCQKLFTEMITDDGVCYTFNILNASEIFRLEATHSKYVTPNHNRTSNEWMLEIGHNRTFYDETENPRHVHGVGISNGLNIFMSTDRESMDLKCRFVNHGFKAVLHSPDEMPQVDNQYYRIPPGSEISLEVKPIIMDTADNLRRYPWETRRCFFEREKDLKFFRRYKGSNCQLECQANFSLASCGCVKFSMPRLNDTKVCGYELQENCVWKAVVELLSVVTLYDEIPKDYQNMCNCLPNCYSLLYDADLAQTKMRVTNFRKNSETQILSRLIVSFRESRIMVSKREELHGQTEFIANCGGLLGLFMGVSFLSFIELIYFCTIRLFVDLYRNYRKSDN